MGIVGTRVACLTVWLCLVTLSSCGSFTYHDRELQGFLTGAVSVEPSRVLANNVDTASICVRLFTVQDSDRAGEDLQEFVSVCDACGLDDCAGPGTPRAGTRVLLQVDGVDIVDPSQPPQTDPCGCVRQAYASDSDGAKTITAKVVPDGDEEPWPLAQRPTVTFVEEGVPPHYLDPIELATGTEPVGIEVADLSGNGHPDLLIANLGDRSLSLVYGQPGRTLETPKRISVVGGVGVVAPRAVALGDVTGDGAFEVVVADAGGSGSIKAYEWDDPLKDIRAETSDTHHCEAPRTAALVDVDDSGGKEIVALCGVEEPTLSVFTVVSDSLSLMYRASSTPPAAAGVALARENGEVLVAVGSEGAHEIFVFSISAEPEAFREEQRLLVLGYPTDVTFADLDADGHQDLVATSFSRSELVYFLYDDDAGLFASTPTRIRLERDPLRLAAADINNDGFPDLAAAGIDDNPTPGVELLMGVRNEDPPWRPTDTPGPTLFFSEGWPSALAVADMNGDGFGDIAVLSRTKHKVFVFLTTALTP